MDISPLPHKPAFSVPVEIGLQSPTPDLTPADSSMLSAPSPMEIPAFQFPLLTLPQEYDNCPIDVY
jgi:M-phase inducer tyrosine phosphatase